MKQESDVLLELSIHEIMNLIVKLMADVEGCKVESGGITCTEDFGTSSEDEKVLDF